MNQIIDTKYLNLIRGAQNKEAIPFYDYVLKISFEELENEKTLTDMDRGTIIAVDLDQRVLFLGVYENTDTQFRGLSSDSFPTKTTRSF